jgi:hypothetical protein
VVFIISLILAALAVIGKFAPIPFFTEQGFWVAVVAYVVLASRETRLRAVWAPSGGPIPKRLKPVRGTQAVRQAR